MESATELEEILEDKDNASRFVYTSTPNVTMFLFEEKLISRAKQRIIDHIQTLEEYDCDEMDEVSTTVIRGIKKESAELSIVETHEKLMRYVEYKNIKQIYFDIDLYYFTIENPTSNDKQYFTYMKDKDIKDTFNLDSHLMQWTMERIERMTIALEPEHTGSVNKSMKYFNLLEKQFFSGSVFQWKTTWRHLKK